LVGRIEESLPHYRHVVKVDPRRVEAWIDGANVLIGLERYPEAHEWLAAASKIHSEHPQILSLYKTLEAVQPGPARHEGVVR
jgi:hypothetical protein